MFGLTGFLTGPSTVVLGGVNFGGLLAIIFAMSPFIIGIGSKSPFDSGNGGGGGGGGGMLHGGETVLGGVGSGVGGGGGKS